LPWGIGWLPRGLRWLVVWVRLVSFVFIQSVRFALSLTGSF
jgi:hypothetical protein